MWPFDKFSKHQQISIELFNAFIGVVLLAKVEMNGRQHLTICGKGNVWEGSCPEGVQSNWPLPLFAAWHLDHFWSLIGAIRRRQLRIWTARLAGMGLFENFYYSHVRKMNAFLEFKLKIGFFEMNFSMSLCLLFMSDRSFLFSKEFSAGFKQWTALLWMWRMASGIGAKRGGGARIPVGQTGTHWTVEEAERGRRKIGRN